MTRRGAFPVHRGYVSGRWGQIHFREAGRGANTTLVCLHATAYSGRTFLPLIAHLATSRRVLALDTPGYGESDGPEAEVDFETYAAALAEAIRELEPTSSVDILGYHTGSLLATEMAVSHPGLIRRLVLIGIPFFAGTEKAVWQAKLVHQTRLSEQFDQFRARWEYFVTNRAPGVSLERAFASFVDELKSYPREWWAHRALFDYEPGPRLARVKCETLVINPASPLAEASGRAAAVIPCARVVAMPELKGAIFDLGADRLARVMNPFLEADDARES